MADLDRRAVLRGAAAAVLSGPFLGFLNRSATVAAPRARLRPVADLRDGVVRLWLPDGSQYRSFHDTESPVVLDDGAHLPGRHDGITAFRGPGDNYLLVRNQELNNPGPAFGDAAQAYDPMAQGGTTTIEVTRFGEVVRAHTSLNGTQMNCSGGPMQAVAPNRRRTERWTPARRLAAGPASRRLAGRPGLPRRPVASTAGASRRGAVGERAAAQRGVGQRGRPPGAVRVVQVGPRRHDLVDPVEGRVVQGERGALQQSVQLLHGARPDDRPR